MFPTQRTIIESIQKKSFLSNRIRCKSDLISLWLLCPSTNQSNRNCYVHGVLWQLSCVRAELLNLVAKVSFCQRFHSCSHVFLLFDVVKVSHVSSNIEFSVWKNVLRDRHEVITFGKFKISKYYFNLFQKYHETMNKQKTVLNWSLFSRIINNNLITWCFARWLNSKFGISLKNYSYRNRLILVDLLFIF